MANLRATPGGNAMIVCVARGAGRAVGQNCAKMQRKAGKA